MMARNQYYKVLAIFCLINAGYYYNKKPWLSVLLRSVSRPPLGPWVCGELE